MREALPFLTKIDAAAYADDEAEYCFKSEEKGENGMYYNGDYLARRRGDALFGAVAPVSAEASDKGKTWGLSGHPLAMVYAPLQEWRELYGEEAALKAGTLFSELEKPFFGGAKSVGGSCGCGGMNG